MNPAVLELVNDNNKKAVIKVKSSRDIFFIKFDLESLIEVSTMKYTKYSPSKVNHQPSIVFVSND
jgi:hypothetical protein